jgi:hypothetical protein
VVVLAVLGTLLAAAALAGRSRFSGPVIVEVVPYHGLHLEDLPVLVVWLLAMWCCWRLWLDRRD